VSPWRETLGLVMGLAISAFTGASAAQPACDQRPNSGGLHESAPLVGRPYLRIKRGSEARNWGHRALLALVQRGARAAALAVPGSRALVGDLSADRSRDMSRTGWASTPMSPSSSPTFRVAR
jgi:hypothetical protein